jgi:hypothetical protein
MAVIHTLRFLGIIALDFATGRRCLNSFDEFDNPN